MRTHTHTHTHTHTYRLQRERERDWARERKRARVVRKWFLQTKWNYGVYEDTLRLFFFFSHYQNISLQTQDKVVVANTHVLFNPRRGDIKLAQLMILLAEIDKCAYLGPSPDAQHLGNLGWWDATKTEHYCPVIVTGDFNMEPQCELYKFLIGGLIDYEDLLVREMAGQEEGSYGRNCWLQRDFFSPLYGVSDFCQYHTLVVERLRQSYQMYSETALASCIRSDGSQFDQLYIQDSHSSYLDTNPGDIGKHQHVMCLESQSNAHTPGCWQTEGIHHLDYPPLMPSSTGRLSHRLNLISAYQHKIQRLNDEAEVTTHHNRAECTVDYIFYSVDHKDACVQDEEIQMNIIEEGHLKLIGRYGLMSGTELDDMGGIPNPTLPSDHLCLIAHFLLQWNKKKWVPCSSARCVCLCLHEFWFLLWFAQATASQTAVCLRIHVCRCMLKPDLLTSHANSKSADNRSW